MRRAATPCVPTAHMAMSLKEINDDFLFRPAGSQLSQAVIRQYYNPPDVDMLFGVIPSPKLEEIFYKSKPRYFKRTSSAVWNSPPFPAAKPVLGLPHGLRS